MLVATNPPDSACRLMLMHNSLGKHQHVLSGEIRQGASLHTAFILGKLIAMLMKGKTDKASLRQTMVELICPSKIPRLKPLFNPLLEYSTCS